MKRLLVLFFLLAGCGAAPTPPTASPGRVVMISLDGFRHDYPGRVDTPHFDQLAREGAHAGRLVPPNPSLTFPGHASLATGADPEVHGILANRFFDREKGPYAYEASVGWYDVDPLWIHATRHGVRTHVFHWVGSAGARGGVEPAEWRPFKKMPDEPKVEQILAWTRAPEAERPRLIMSYFAGCDHAGHEHGPDSPEVTACIGDTDARLGRLLTGLAAAPDPWTLVLVSDHGMTRTVAEVNPVHAIRAAGFSPGDVRITIGGPTAHLYVAEGVDRARLRAVAEALPDTVVEVPARKHPTRTGDLVLHATRFGLRYNHKLAGVTGPVQLPGHHGGDPEHPDMGAIFYVWGAGARPGASVPTARAQTVAALVCTILGIPAPAHAAPPVEGLLRR